MAPPLIAHIVHRLDYGGLENGLVNLINGLPAARLRHAVICLTDYSDFRNRIQRPDCEVIALHKRPGKDLPAYGRLWRILRTLRPSVVHTRNMGTLDCAPIAWAAGTPVRLHGYHGWDVDDLHGDRPRRNLQRRLCNPFVTHYVTVSAQITRWLDGAQGIDSRRITHIYNGVDIRRFAPASAPAGPQARQAFVIGTVGRLEAVKDQLTLVRAFAELRGRMGPAGNHLRLLVVGDGSCRSMLQAEIERLQLSAVAEIRGWKDEIAEQMHDMDVFVLPSLNEGISNTILEAMACGLPVIATAVGGNAELVEAGVTGQLIEVGDTAALADAIGAYAGQPETAVRDGQAARQAVERLFSIPRMLDNYAALYERFTGQRGR